MTLTSPAFQNNDYIPQKYTCDGENISPELHITDIPEHTQSLVLIMYDPDVPERIMPSGEFYHWVVFNIPPDTTHIPEGTEPEGTCAGGDANQNCEYYGPCPPGEEHRYFFIVYALETMFDLEAKIPHSQFLNHLERERQLARAELMGRYTR